MSLIISKPGILTTVQDLGRTGGRRFGINPGGPMDTAAARVVNILLENNQDAPVLEMYFPAAEIEFADETAFAIGGADFDASLDGVPLRNWSTGIAKKGGVLRFRKKQSGNIAYLAVAGGLRADEWLGSSATSLAVGLGGFHGRKLASGDHIECEPSDCHANLIAGLSLIPRYSRFPTVRVVPGSEYEFLTATSERSFQRDGFTLTKDCDRMGFRLDGKPLHLLDAIQMVSAAVSFGTIQLLPDGQLIVLMADHQTSGGYPRIANVIPSDLPLLSQCGPGDGVSFEVVSLDDAEDLAMQFESELNLLRVGCRLQARC